MEGIISNLPPDKQKIIKALINKIESEYKKDIAVVVCYGSYITNTAYQKSDLDFVFIPKTKRGYEMARQFIIDGIGYDFWPLSWQRAERIANFKENNQSIIAEGVIAYYNKSEDLNRFRALQQRIEEITNNTEKKGILINKADKLLSRAKSLYFDMKCSSEVFETVDSYCSQILNLLVNVTALLNSTYIKKGVYNIENEISDYSDLPKHYLNHINSVVSSDNITAKQDLIKKMILNTEELWQKKKSEPKKKINNERFKGFFEEIKSNYNKLNHACESGDYLKVYFTAHLIEHEVKSMLGNRYKEFDFPNLILNIDQDNLTQLKNMTYQHEAELVKLLKENEISIRKYQNTEEFVESVQEN